jgi:hypothetical protein
LEEKMLIRLVVFAIALSASTVLGQVTSVHTTGLNAPNKIIKAPDNSLLVTEGGTAAPNSGRVSVIDRTSGARHTLISGLPSAVSFLGGPAGDPDGPSGILLRGNRLWLTIGVGDSVVPGGGPGLESPNPTPSSPIFNSVLELTLPGGFTELDSPFVMTPANQETLDDGDPVPLTNAEGVSMIVRLVADLPDWRPAPTPTVPGNVKASHLFGIEVFQRTAYVVDSGHNEIKAVSLVTGEWETFIAFPARPNPTPMGPPFIEAVPTNIHRFGNRLLVPLLTGFPFVPNLAEVRRVNIKGVSDEQFIGGLTSAMDIAKVEEEADEATEVKDGGKGDEASDLMPALMKSTTSRVGRTNSLLGDAAFAPGDGNAFYTLEFSTNMLGGALGRLRFYQEPDAVPVNVLTNLVTPTSMTRDADTGNLFITNIAPGTVTKVSFP